MLYDTTYDSIDLSKSKLESTGFTVALTSGSKLTVENVSKTTTYTLANGDTWTYDGSTKSFKQA